MCAVPREMCTRECFHLWTAHVCVYVCVAAAAAVVVVVVVVVAQRKAVREEELLQKQQQKTQTQKVGAMVHLLASVCERMCV